MKIQDQVTIHTFQIRLFYIVRLFGWLNNQMPAKQPSNKMLVI